MFATLTKYRVRNQDVCKAIDPCKMSMIFLAVAFFWFPSLASILLVPLQQFSHAMKQTCMFPTWHEFSHQIEKLTNIEQADKFYSLYRYFQVKRAPVIKRALWEKVKLKNLQVNLWQTWYVIWWHGIYKMGFRRFSTKILDGSIFIVENIHGEIVVFKENVA